MRYVTALIAVFLLAVVALAQGASVDLVATFGGSAAPCTLSSSKAVIHADGVDSSVVALTDMKGNTITTPVGVVNARNNKETLGVVFPVGGFTLVATAPGDWVLTIDSPSYRCNSVEITAY